LVFAGGSSNSCVDDLWPHVVVNVRRGGRAVDGRIDIPGGTGLLVFRPDEPWIGGERYDVRVSIDNAGIGGEASWIATQEECDLPAEVELSFVAATEVSPPLPIPSPPVNISATRIVDDLEVLACCPGVTPVDDGTAGCDWEYSWPQPGDCAYLYEETFVSISAELPDPPDLLRGQVLYQLVVDGDLVAREAEFLWLWVSRAAPACAWIESIHLGTGETQRSIEACTPAELAATLGAHLRDVELQCDAPMLCGSSYEWSADACTPYDQDLPPTPPLLPSRDWAIETECEAIEIPGGIRPQRRSSGCSCASTPTAPPLFGILALLGLARRRRR